MISLFLLNLCVMPLLGNTKFLPFCEFHLLKTAL
uniref:Uncharacterized protein n=1 Tax=Arundo donax TaxID=35708 RepID=A0A0A8ZXD5_ARUDO